MNTDPTLKIDRHRCSNHDGVLIKVQFRMSQWWDFHLVTVTKFSTYHLSKICNNFHTFPIISSNLHHKDIQHVRVNISIRFTLKLDHSSNLLCPLYMLIFLCLYYKINIIWTHLYLSCTNKRFDVKKNYQKKSW